MRHIYSKHRGFTIPELLIAISISTIVMVGLISLITSLSQVSSRTLKTSEQIRNNQSIISAIQEDLRSSKAFTATNTVPDSDSSASPAGAGGWTYKGTGEHKRMLVLQTFATTAATQDSSRRIVYFDDGVGGCPVGRTPVYNNVIYYLKDTTLFRRTLVPTTPTVAPLFCTGQTPSQIRTCTTPGAPGMPANCGQRDVAIASNISAFEVEYFQNAHDETALDTIYDVTISEAGVQLNSMSSVRVSITTSGVEGSDIAPYTTHRRLTKGMLHEK